MFSAGQIEGVAPIFVAYLRVSTDRQGASGLGLEAQREAVDCYVARNGGAIVSEFVEVESGKKSNRPELHAALAECRRRKGTLLIAKLDRLARSVHFISGLMEGGVDFKAVDNPHANRLMLHLLAAFAEHEREMISQRTKAALQAAKARGVVLGANGRRLARSNAADAARYAAEIGPVIRGVRAEGITSFASIAGALNDRGVQSRNGGRWHAATVARVCKRMSDSE